MGNPPQGAERCFDECQAILHHLQSQAYRHGVGCNGVNRKAMLLFYTFKWYMSSVSLSEVIKYVL